MPDVSTPAAPSPAQDNAQQASPLEGLTLPQRDEWLKTGKLPEPPKEEAPATSDAPVKDGGKSADGEKPPETPPAPDPEKKPEETKEPKKQTGVEKRIGQLTKAYREAEREAAELRDRLARMEAEKSAPPQPAAKPADGKPDPATFQTYEEYIEALTDWKLEQKETAAKNAAEQKAKQDAADRQRQVAESWEQKVNQGIEKYPDFEETLSVDIQLPGNVMSYIIAADRGADLAYFLAKNPAEAQRVSELVPVAAKRELDKLISRLDGAPETGAPEPKKVTAAAPPVTELGGGKSIPADELTDAIKDRDFARFSRLQNERELRAHR